MGQDSFGDIPGTRNAQTFIPSVAAATATESHPIFSAPDACIVTSVKIIPQAAVTGDNTDRKNLNIIDCGSDGSGTTEVGNLDLATGVNLTAFDEKNIPLNSTYTDGVTMAKGDVIKLQFEKAGNGVLVPNLLVRVEYAVT